MDMPLDTPMEFTGSSRAERPLGISLEFVAYAALLAVGLVLRMAELDTIPLMASETHNALAAWRVIMPNAAGIALVSSSPLLFALQSLSFTLFGASEVSARIATVIGGLLLIATPALFRPLIGRTHAFLLSLMLAFSPVLLIASRASSPDVWALLLAVLSVWAFLQAGRTEKNLYGVMAVVLFFALAFLTGAGGLALSLILVVAGLLAGLWHRRGTLLNDEDRSASSAFAVVRKSLNIALPLAALVVLAVGTGFMLYPSGLGTIGETVGGVLRAVLQPQGSSGYATQISLFYEPMLWGFAIVSLIIRRDRLGTLDIFLTAWVVLGVIVTAVFADGSPDHALWLTIPLATLTANAIAAMLVPDTGLVFPAAPRWARWIIAVSAIGVLAVFSIAFQSMARSMIQAVQPTLTAVSPQADSVILVLVSVMFLFIGYFMFASLWGSRTAWQGIGLGFVIFGMITSLGAGWSASVTNAENPVVFWHGEATNSNTILLRKTLFDVADRISRGFPTMPISVTAPQDGVVAWILRDFNNATYITDLNNAQNAEVVLLPRTVQSPALGAAYLGENFIISRSWDRSTLNAIDVPGWWTQGQSRVAWSGQNEYVLWLRQDVYQGLNQITSTQSTG